MGFALERVNQKDEVRILNEHKPYSCGRDKSSTIVCFSPTISRKHCIFYVGNEGVTVLDLQSSNGVFINGDKIPPHNAVTLRVNDIVGLGSCALDNFTTTDFVYRLKQWNENCILDNKRKLKSDIGDEVPCKIIKSEDNGDVEIIEIEDGDAKMEVDENCPGPSAISDISKKYRNIQKPRKAKKQDDSCKVTNHDRSNEPIKGKNTANGEIDRQENVLLNGKDENNAMMGWMTSTRRIKEELPNSVWIKYEDDIPEDEGIFDLPAREAVPYASPLKIKMPKPQSKSRYSDIDGVVHLSDEEEDVFPCSQLFDNIVETNDNKSSTSAIRIKNEQENYREDDEGGDAVEDEEIDGTKYLFNSQNEEPPFITLSDDDDDDEDNPWVRRLLGSQSQRESIIAESKNREISPVLNIDSSENNREFCEKVDEFDSTKLNTNDVEAENDGKPVKREKKKRKKRRQSANDLTNDKSNSGTNVESSSTSGLICDFNKTIEKENRRNSDDDQQTKIVAGLGSVASVSHDSKVIPVDRDSDGQNRSSAHPELLTETSSKQKIIEKLIAQSSKKTSKRIPQIEPPFLPRGERHGVSCAVTSTGKTAADVSAQAGIENSNHDQDTHNNDADILPPHKKYTAKEKKQFAPQQKIDEAQHQKEQKLRRLKLKFAEKSPPKSRRVSSLTREEKEERKQDRKERLKKIADEKKKPDEENSTAKRVNKPRAKVSMKNRGDFLIADQLNASMSGEDVDKSSTVVNTTTKSKKTKTASNPKVAKSANSLVAGKTQNESIQDPKKHDIEVFKTKNKDERCSNRRSISKNDISHNNEVNESHPKKGLPTDDMQPKLSGNNFNSKRKENIAPVTMELAGNLNIKKKVSFNEGITQVHTFIIPDGNNLNKCVRTDLLLKERPPKKIASTDMNDLPHPKLEEFLLRLFHWNPLWLEEQQSLPMDPPVVDQKSLFPVLTSYKSYDDYYNIMSPLLALEIWHGLSKDFESNEMKAKRTTLQASIVENSVTRTPIPSTDLTVTTFMLEALATKKDIERQSHPVYGDLVVLELATIRKGRVDFLKIFAYVTSVMQTVLTAFTRYNPDLAKHVKNPHTLLTYTMITRPIQINDIQTNVIQRLRTVSYLRSNLRMVQAIQYLPMSPLLKSVLRPDVVTYKLPTVNDFESYPLVTKDNLNAKQLEAVLRITDTVIQRAPKISMIQGPPGTGKSKVIVNIITEILYGANRYQNKKHPRILVCAPSNAAIDEIVLRLLAIRANFQPKEQRFRMVRLGRTDTMNPGVKSISVTELAKRDVDKTLMECCSTDKSSLESIELEKSFLLGRINAMSAEIESSTIVDITYKQHLERKLAALKVKYDFLNNQNSKKNVDRKLLSKLQRSAENTILTCADIITCTLSSCYTNQMEAHFGGTKERISVCIVDEATQSIEAETLIPLMLGVTKLVLVGDPNQLPATVISQQAKKLGLDQSLFARLQGSFDRIPGDPVIVLDTQYRMSYPISYWPNKYFYGARLKNCANMRSLPFHFYKILNLTSTQDKDRFSNTDEAAFVSNIIFTMMTYSNLDKLDSILRIGIITPYNNQRTLINAKLKERLATVPENLRKKVMTEVNTVDSFQGQERDVIIMSCVRSNGIGFLSDRQRLCVALTRAKHTLIICGNFRAFEKNGMWRALLTDARSRKVYFNVDHKSEPTELKTYLIKQ